MAEQEQHNPRSDRVQQLRFRQLLRRVDGMQKGDQPKNMVINGSKGVGKTIGVETFCSTKKDV
jgi:DNA replication protein DnaC